MDNRQLANRVWPEHEFTDAIEAPAERKLIKRIIFLITGSVLIMLLWSLFAEVEEISKSKGQVVPLGHRQIIQSRAGGTMASVMVEEGDVVKKGDVLASFVSIDSQSAEEELASKRANLLLRIERYESFIDQREANFSEFEVEYPQLVKLHTASLSRMNQERVAMQQLSESDIAKSQAEIDGLLAEIPPLSDQIKTAEQTLTMMQSVTAEQAVSKLRILESQQKLDSYMRELRSMESKQQVLAKNLLNLEQQLNQKKVTLLKEVGEKRTDAQAELLGIIARLKSSGSLVSQNTIIAPVDGIIQSIPSSSTGSVIQPGGTVAVIVPMTKTGLMEAKLSPRDIGFVKVGQPVRIKIDAFDYSRYGALDGIVKRISPSTDSDEKGGVFYKVQIAIDKPYFSDKPGRFDLIPGMTGEADIVTGDKTVFQYLWKPVFTNVTEAFGER
ncbi:HlyD family type I secretion periplasmic adaptor subunit [Shewanella sp. Choline-02u-19]|uniref:HlyD family type I secretion periplasmic adaptor subunit n=1 Tax=unclassified Shewanella TaxID=196818 RepID=UPI000C34F9FE|nr:MULTISPECIES: HlyD family type I secretion periplasmic adaptor subunit [unclassified Shewanella]PKH60352.1 HlyD family type I secretion periplasmic adaptor subunit [Shewanella sp. Bg11-22]PKI29841.1 HlyD family type I secretion periplasmic adaptor subunit [Shewanella sp. Choline-02u-19]